MKLQGLVGTLGAKDEPIQEPAKGYCWLLPEGMTGIVYAQTKKLY